ncbi:MAG: hypothetical protein CFH06_00067, partial [Alphaproteobacteria bacterium MarineAlpha3_Bin5]
ARKESTIIAARLFWFSGIGDIRLMQFFVKVEVGDLSE